MDKKLDDEMEPWVLLKGSYREVFMLCRELAGDGSRLKRK